MDLALVGLLFRNLSVQTVVVVVVVIVVVVKNLILFKIRFKKTHIYDLFTTKSAIILDK